MQIVLFKIVIFCCLLSQAVFALECYVCEEQEENNDKCSKTVRQCNETEDTCMSFLFWTPPIDMTPRGERRHYYTKSCASAEHCQKILYAFTPICTRNWWEDWTCVECCKGDRCNKYVFLGASTNTISMRVMFLFGFVSLFIKRFLSN